MQRFERSFDFARGTMEAPIRALFDGEARQRLDTGSSWQRPRVSGYRATITLMRSGGSRRAWLTSRAPGARFGITLARGFRPNEAKVGWLKSAYIVAFAALGYTYVLTSQLQPIRDQIAAPNEELVSGFWANQSTADLSTRALGLIRFGDDVSSLAVQMGRQIVFLPMPGEGDAYAYLAATFSKGAQFNLDCKVLPWPRTLVMGMDQSPLGRPQGRLQ